MPNPPPTTPHRTPTGSIAPGYFEALYAAEADPWDYATSDYEAEKYAATLAALPAGRFANALEIGCSIGVLTELLAPRCDALTAVDVAPAALARARARLARLDHVRVQRAVVPDETPEGPFSLVVLSEVGYYLARPDLTALRSRLAAAVVPGGALVLVHYTGETDYPLSAADVHDAFLSDAAWRPVCGADGERYRLDVATRA